MFKKTDPQLKLFGVHTSVSDSLQKRLSASWAAVFRAEVLPILMRSEDKFSILYGTTGRPNFSVGRMIGICLLQEWHNLADQQALDAFGFDLRWRHALDVSQQEAYLSRRSLVEFRRRLVCKDPEMKLIHGIFIEVGKTVIDKLGVSTSQQRLDSTHIESNIRYRGRIALFQDTIHLFLKKLRDWDYQQIPEPIRQWHEAQPEGWFGLGENEKKARLVQLAQYTHTLIELFSQNEAVKSSTHYRLIVRLFTEQCEVKTTQNTDSSEGEHNQTDKQGDDDSEKPCNSTQAQQNDAKIEVRKKVKGETLQSAFDTDASYGHKGTGYSAHIAETCNNCDKPEIITDYEVHGAHRSDAAKTTDVLNRLGKVDLVPETLFTDGGYPTVPSAMQVVDTGVELVCPINRGPLVDNNTMSREHFRFSDDNRVICCPNGHAAIDHRILSNGTEPSLHAIFDGDICRQCAKLEQCPVRAPNHRARGCSPRNTVGNFRLEITRELRLRDAMFERQKTRQWKDRYQIRSGVEATMSELKRLGMGKLRVRGLIKVIFAVSCKVIACNIKRWWKAVISAGPCQNPQNDPGNAANCIFCALEGFIFSILVPIWIGFFILRIANKPYMYGINSI